MKNKPGFDDELQPKRLVLSLPVPSIGQLVLIVIACALPVVVMAGMERHQRNVRRNPARVARPPLPFPQANALVAPARDPFVVMAAPEIDAKMVVPAPVGIDEAMVVNPYTGERQLHFNLPAQGNPAMPFPEYPFGQLPENVYPPRPLVPGQPR